MVAIAADDTNAPSLTFASSESKTVGITGSWMDRLRENAPRIVGSMKLVGDITVGLSGDPFFMAYSTFAVIGRLIMIGYGTKKNQEEAAKNMSPEVAALKNDDSFFGTLKKISHPKEYPVETSAYFSVGAEVFGVLSGLASGAWTPVALGAVAVGSYAYMMLGKEKKTDTDAAQNEASLKFARSHSEAQGWFGSLRQQFKDNPVFASSIINAGISIAMIVGKLFVDSKKLSSSYLIAGAIFLAANMLQAFLVRKQEFNVEGAGKSAEAMGPWEKAATEERNRQATQTRNT